MFHAVSCTGSRRPWVRFVISRTGRRPWVRLVISASAMSRGSPRALHLIALRIATGEKVSGSVQH